jgi:ABC-type phosphate transport system substrate-binding protein
MGLVVSLLALGTSLPASAVSTKSLIANSLVLKNATSSPVLTGGDAADANFLGAALSAYEAVSAANAASFSTFASTTSADGRAGFVAGTYNVGLSAAPLNALGTDVTAGTLNQYLQIPVGTVSAALVYNITFPSSVTMTATVGQQTLSATTTDSCAALLVRHPLVVTPAVLSGIFSGQITSWANATLIAANPRLQFKVLVPTAASTVVNGTTRPQRNTKQLENCLMFTSTPTISVLGAASGSSSNYILTDYLSQYDSIDFPSSSENALAVVASPLSSSATLTSAVAGTSGAISCVSWAAAVAASVPPARIQQVVGSRTTVTSLRAASVKADVLRGVATISAHGGFDPTGARTSYDIINAGAGYPLTAFEFAVVNQSQTSSVNGIAIAKFLCWLTQAGRPASNFGQALTSKNDSATLPRSLRSYDLSALLRITSNTSTLLTATD